MSSNTFRNKYSIYREVEVLVDGEITRTLTLVGRIWGRLDKAFNFAKALQFISGNRPDNFPDKKFSCSSYFDLQFRDIVFDGTNAYRIEVPERTSDAIFEASCTRDSNATTAILAL